MPRNVLLAVAAVYAFVGLWGLISPEGLLSTIDLRAHGPDGVNDARAMYGGLQLGIAAVLGWHASVEDKLSDGLLIAGLSVGGLGSARLLSVILTEVTPLSLGLGLLELGTALVCLWLSQRS